MQNELLQPGPLLDSQGRLAQVGWSRSPLLDCNLENVNFYKLHAFQRFRIKRWDYYAVFTPRRFFSATIADLGYAGNIFVYTLDFLTGELHEEGLVVPLGKGIELERNPESGEACFSNQKASLNFTTNAGERHLDVRWPAFDQGRGIQAEIFLSTLPRHESMNIIIPIGAKRFYDNTKINCMPARGFIQYGDLREELRPGLLCRLARLGSRGMAIPELLELGQRLWVSAKRADHRPKPGPGIWRPKPGHRERHHRKWPGPQAGRGPLRLQIRQLCETLEFHR